MQRSGVALGRGRQLSPHNATLAPPVRTPTVVEKSSFLNRSQRRDSFQEMEMERSSNSLQNGGK